MAPLWSAGFGPHCSSIDISPLWSFRIFGLFVFYKHIAPLVLTTPMNSPLPAPSPPRHLASSPPRLPASSPPRSLASPLPRLPAPSPPRLPAPSPPRHLATSLPRSLAPSLPRFLRASAVSHFKTAHTSTTGTQSVHYTM